MNKAVGILVNDIHLDKENGILVKSIFEQLINQCKEYDTNRIFCGGDVFTNRSGQPLQCLTDWKEIIELLGENDIELHVIPGNHDKTDNSNEKSYLDVYNYDNYHNYRFASAKLIDDIIFVFIPYFSEEKWLEEFEKINKKIEKSGLEKSDKRKKILITHVAIDGVMNNDGSEVNSPITISSFKSYSKVLVGHYHNYSQIAKNIFYTGSAYQNNFGENIDDKGFTVIYDNGDIEFINSVFPKYIKEIIKATDKETLRKMLEKYGNDRKNFIRFIFVGKKVDCEKINIAEIQSKYGIDCKFESNESKEAIEISESDSVYSFDKKDIKKDFIKFCGENKILGKQLKYGLDLIKNI